MYDIKSAFLSLNGNDFIKGLIVAVFGAVISLLYQLVNNGGDIFTMLTLQNMGSVALTAALAYLLKQFTTNSDGQPFSGER